MDEKMWVEWRNGLGFVVVFECGTIMLVESFEAGRELIEHALASAAFEKVFGPK